MPHAIIFGASSDIARSFASLLSEKGYDLTLFSRNKERLVPYIKELTQTSSTRVSLIEFDAKRQETFEGLLSSVEQPFDLALLAFGVLEDNESALEDADLTFNLLQVNYVAFVLLANLLSLRLKKQGHGSLIGMSSIAGVRGRKSNFIYGSTKSGVSTYLSGLGSYLKRYKVNVTHVVAGYVDTKMTAHLDLPRVLTSTPDKLARKIYRKAVQLKRRTVYSSMVWSVIALIFRLLPRVVLDRMNI